MKVRFVPQNIEFEIGDDESVLRLAKRTGVFIKSVCNGVPSCTECRVRIVEGEHNVLPPGTTELSLIGSGYFIDRRRLSCQLRCFGDVTIDLTEQISKQNSPNAKKPKGGKAGDEFEDSYAIKGALLDETPELDANAAIAGHSDTDLRMDPEIEPSRAPGSSDSRPGNAPRPGSVGGAARPQQGSRDSRDAGGGDRRPRGRRGGRGRDRDRGGDGDRNRESGRGSGSDRGPRNAGGAGPRNQSGGARGPNESGGPRNTGSPRGPGSGPVVKSGPTPVAPRDPSRSGGNGSRDDEN